MISLHSLLPLLGGAMVQRTSFWLPPQSSTLAPEHDALFYFILYVSVVSFCLVVGTMVYFAIRFRRRSQDQKTHPIQGNKKLEIFWIVIPSIILAVIFLMGFRGFVHLSIPPGNAMEIRVTGQMWFWSFDYPKEGINSSELVVPAGKPIKLIMSSKDVIHSFFVPDFRIKRDLLPNRYAVVWFQADEPGEHHILCAEYCGTNHSRMLSTVKVLKAEDYQDWVDSGGMGAGAEGLSSIQLGKILFRKKACVTCHSIDGTRLVGPTLKGKYGSQETLVDGSQVPVDDNYLRRSIMDPASELVSGFPPVMPTYKGILKDKQVDALIDYIKSLGRESGSKE